MRTVWRYEVPVQEEATTLRVPGGWAAGFVHVAAAQPGVVTVWLEVDTERDAEDVRLAVTGTGHPAPDGGTRIGTAPAPLGLVWHLWRLE